MHVFFPTQANNRHYFKTLGKEWHDNIGEPTLADAIMDHQKSNTNRIELKNKSMMQKK